MFTEANKVKTISNNLFFIARSLEYLDRALTLPAEPPLNSFVLLHLHEAQASYP